MASRTGHVVGVRVAMGAGAALVAAGLLGAPAQARAGSVLSDYNVIVTGDMTTHSHVDGTMVVGGAFHGDNAVLVMNPKDPVASYVGKTTVTVGGDVTGNFQVNAGSLQYGGTNSASIIFNGGSGTGATYASFSAQSIKDSIKALSDDFAAMSPLDKSPVNGSINDSDMNSFRFYAGPGVSVFTIDAAHFAGFTGTDIYATTTLGSIDAVIINVLGSSATWSMNFNGNFSSLASKIIWNFNGASNISLGKTITGTVLAPDAHLYAGNNVDGTVAVQSLEMQGEVHLHPFGYTPPTAVPTPTAALSGLALLPLGVLAARRRRI